MRTPATDVAFVGQTASSLTPRELEWLRAVATGANENEVGRMLGVHPQTAKNRGQGVRRKLGVHSTIEAFAAIGWLRVSLCDCGCSSLPSPHPPEARHPNPKACIHAA